MVQLDLDLCQYLINVIVSSQRGNLCSSLLTEEQPCCSIVRKDWSSLSLEDPLKALRRVILRVLQFLEICVLLLLSSFCHLEFSDRTRMLVETRTR